MSSLSIISFAYLLCACAVWAQDTFNEIQGACILDNNREYLQPTTLQACLDACRAMDWCASCEYRARTRMCHLSEVNSVTAGDNFHAQCHVSGYNLYDKVIVPDDPCEEDPNPCVESAVCSYDSATDTVCCECPEGQEGDGLVDGMGCQVPTRNPRLDNNFGDAYCHLHSFTLTELEGCTVDPAIEASYCHGFCWSYAYVDWTWRWQHWDIFKFCYCCEPQGITWRRTTLTCQEDCNCTTDLGCSTCERNKTLYYRHFDHCSCHQCCRFWWWL